MDKINKKNKEEFSSEKKIFNLNCWLLPTPFSPKNKERINGILDLIKSENPDIITLQEVWLKKYARDFEENLSEYKFFYSKSEIFNKSGLLTGVKRSVISFYQDYFPITKNHSRREKIGLKGFQALEISKNVFVINTQLYAPENSHEKSIAVSQFKQIEKFSEGKKVILSGDLNLDEDVFLRVNKTFYYKSPLGFTIANKNPYCNIRLNALHDADRTIDYIVSNDKKMFPNVKIFNPVNLSDHYPMKGLFRIS